jgi:2-polyprenyl-6-methoxyphenol hydroxylase-like FAD-dependent oxidoreductase
MEIMDDLGLASRLLELPHTKIHQGVGETIKGGIPFYDFSRLKTRFPYVTMLPQSRFLEFITREAALWPGFELRMRSAVDALVLDGVGSVTGVRYRHAGGECEIRARLTVGCDGRASSVRRLAGLRPAGTSPPIDVLWFRIPRSGPVTENGFRSLIGPGYLLVLVDRGDYWQAGCVIRKGSFQRVRDEGVEAFRRSLERMAPELEGRLRELDWSRVSVLRVSSMRLSRWWKPGLLLIGDAAHAMSPIGGAGINIAIQDAVVAANVVAQPLRRGILEEVHLASVEQRRAPAVWIVQAFQRVVEKWLVSAALEGRGVGFLRWLMRLPGVGALPSRLVAFGPWRVHIRGQR